MADKLTQQPEDQEEKFRSFTVRVPHSVYLQMAEMARKESVYLNSKVNQLLLLGLGEHIKLDEVLLRLIKTKLLDEELTEND